MMVLAVHIIGDGATEGDKTGAWRNTGKPAAWQAQGEQFSQGDAGFCSDDAVLPVGFDEAVQRTQGNHFVAAGQTAVAIAAAVAERQGAAGTVGRGSNRLGKLFSPVHAGPVLRVMGILSPRAQQLAHIAIQNTRPNSRPMSRLTRSRTANTTGSSCILPRWASIQARVIHTSNNGQASQITSGWRYRATVLWS